MKKKIFSFIVIIAGLVTAVPAAFAQDVRSNKTITGPDDNGVYTISLEAYATGSKVTTETLVPMDIVLCLAYNNSLLGYGAASLRQAVASFIQIIQEKDIEKDENGQPTGNRVGYRVAIDFYGVKSLPSGVPSEAINTLHPVSMYAAQVSGNDGIVTFNGSGDIFPRDNSHMNGNEKANVGLSRAYNILYGPGAEIQDNPIVVFFTNGTPGAQSGSGWNSGQDTQQAINAMEEAYPLKENGATVVSVGLYSTSHPDNMTDWLYLTSSDYVDVNGVPLAPPSFPRSTPSDVTGVNSIIGDVNELVGIFSSIASSIGGDYNIGSASSVLIDIVSTSFTVSTEADLGEVTVWRVPCSDNQPGMHDHSFNYDLRNQFNTVETQEQLDAITDPAVRERTVVLDVDPDTGEIIVTGFDYGKNWCGYEVNETNPSQSGPHGYKVLLEIPITANTDAVGGPNVKTNADGSGLIIKDNEGNQIGDMIEFESPVVSLPVNIHITKTGLEKGESAKFMIERAYIPEGASADWDPESLSAEAWNYVSTVFVTKSSDTDPVVKVRGLPANGETTEGEVTVRHNFIYRVSEEGWSWSYEPAEGNENPQYTDTKHVDNPFRFNNKKRSNIQSKVHHAESKVTNVFKENGGPEYVDSKNNGR